MKISKSIAQIRGNAVKKQTTDLDNVKSFSAEEKDFRGLNKIVRVPFPKPKTLPVVQTTIPGSAPDNGKLKEDKQEKPEENKPDKPLHKMDNSLKGLKRRMKNSQGHLFLKPQAEAYVAPNTGNNNYAQNLPVNIGVKPKVDKRLLVSKKEVYADSNRDTAYVAREDVIASIDELQPIFENYLNEELKVGEKEDVDGNNEAKKVRGTNAKGPGTGKVGVVKRKYLGNQRGRTATGQKAHVIDTEPVIGAQNKNWNKTTPSGERKGK